MFCEIILDSMENNIFGEYQKSAEIIAKFEYFVKVVKYSLDHMLKNHARYINIY